MPEKDDIIQGVRNALSAVPYPGFTRDVVSLGTVRDIAVDAAGGVSIELLLPAGAGTTRGALEQAVTLAAMAVEGVNRVTIARAGAQPRGAVRSLPAAGSTAPQGRPAPSVATPPKRPAGPQARNIIGVASGKGGVGKSTVAVNLAVSLARKGRRVGFLDADVHGPSAPLMFGLEGRRPEVTAEGGRPLPVEAHGVHVMSMGFFVERENAVIWRGPIVGNFIRQLLADVDWGELDDLVIDFPPGTGDAQLTISQTLTMSGSLIVSTPNDLALVDALKAIAMFRKVRVPILGLVENMSGFACPHCRETTHVFGKGGVEQAARSHDVPLLARIPIDPLVVADSDAGRPVVLTHPESPAAAAFESIAETVIDALETQQQSEPGKNRLGQFLDRFGSR